ncbi:uncharacterized protein LOC131072267 isoform X2 [Cryptomeria japonica]|uniref:uncharacterized protein LOC131072267 isoform X2 n=1 Tax=Cryptomeria japonica TaxID=3369 RepID=UPI0027DA1F6B|nr:uncharacterized protein LOC131072267 isoform X2 [Cryptomeria japonica]XP_057864385.2 uncharacterized protein LOC131072267 isoform X2 [Cryptomeria japonica]
MHRAPKWKAEKNRVKAVFRLQLQATQVPQPGWEKLFVSFIPAETGKASAKTTKVSVRNGSCKWSDPIYETTRLLQDMKTRKFDEKLYKLAVSTGSSRYGYLGEADINLADYAESVNPSTVSLPLQSCNFGTILHVTIQLLTAKTGFREFEQQRELTERGLRIGDDEHDGSALASEEKIDGLGIKEKPRASSAVRLRPGSQEVSSIKLSSKTNRNYRGHVAGATISLSTAENNYSSKQQENDVSEVGGITNGINQDAEGFPSSLSQISKPPLKSSISNGQVQMHMKQIERSSGEWTHGWSSDYSTENDVANVYEENERLKVNLQIAESSIMQLKTEIASLEKQAEGQAAEINTLMQQLTTEIKQERDAIKNSNVRSESGSIKSDYEQLQVPGHGKEEHKHVGNGWLDMGDSKYTLEDLKKELDSEKQVNMNLKMQLEKTQEAHSKLLLGFQGDFSESKTKEIEQIPNRKPQAMVIEDKNQGLKGTEIDWLQKLTSSEHKVREIKEKIILKDDGRILEFLGDDLEVLERLFQEFRQENISMISKLNGKMIASDRKIAEVDPDKRSFPGEFFLPCNILTNFEINGCGNGNSCLYLDDRETPNSYQLCKQKNTSHDIHFETHQFSGNTEKINGFDKSGLEFQLSEAKQQIEALSASNYQLETRIQSLVEDRHDLQNRLNTVLAREQNGDFMEESLIITGEDYEPQTKRSQHIGNDQDEIYSKMFLLGKKKSQLIQNSSQFGAEKHGMENDKALMATTKLSEVVRKGETDSDSTLEMQKRIYELSAEAEDYKKARDSLAYEIEQLEYKYEALICELEERVSYLGNSEKQLQEHLENLRDEHRASLYSISTLESQLEKLKQELDQQAASYSADRDKMALSKSELEQRANRAEMALKKTRLHNANTVGQLQKELEHLSLQISCTFDANEKLATQAFAEASQLCVQKDELEDQLTIMQETLEKANKEIAETRQQGESQVQKLTTQLNLSKKSEEELLLKLQNMANELENQIESEGDYIKRDEELSARISMLEREVQTLSNEKINLIQKAEECNIVKAELQSTKISLNGCKAERTGIEALLQRVNEEKIKFEKELCSLNEMLRNSDTEFDELKCCKDERHEEVASLHLALENIVADKSSYIEQKNKLLELQSQHSELKQRLSEQELKTAEMKHLFHSQKELQQKAEAEVSQLCAQKNDLEEYSSGLQSSLQNAKDEIAFITGQYEGKVQELMTQLDLSNKQREEMIARLQNAWNDKEKCMNNETNHIKRNQELASKISMLEIELQSVLKDKSSLTQRVKECDGMRSDFEKNKQNLDSTKVQNAELKSALQKVKHESRELENELISLKAALESADRELDELKCSKNELEITAAFLKSKLDNQYTELALSNEHRDELIELHKQYGELKHRFSEKEEEAEELRKRLAHSVEHSQKADVEVSQICARNSDLEKQLSIIQESLQIASAENESLRLQVEAKMQELDLLTKEREDLLSKLENAMADLELQKKSEENSLRANKELSIKISLLETEVQTALNGKMEVLHKVEDYEAIIAELESNKSSLNICNTERAALEDSLDRATEEKGKLDKELGLLKELLRDSDSELFELKQHRAELETEVKFLQSKENEQNDELMQLHSENNELKLRFSEQELKMEDLRKYLAHFKDLSEKADLEASQLHARNVDLEKLLSVVQQSLQMANADNESMQKQLAAKVQELDLSTIQRQEFLLKLQNAMSDLEVRTKSEATYLRENKELSVKISLLETELETAVNEKMKIIHNCEELKVCKAELEDSLDSTNEEKEQLDKELGLLKEMLRNLNSELDELNCHRDELEITVTVLESKMDEQNDELIQLHNECIELKGRLSEKEVMAEELRRHSIQLKELQQKAEAEVSQLHVRKKEMEEHSIMVQESLRIAFIREQFEAKEQELMNQLEMSKRHGEDLMSKLQDRMKELEIQKSNEIQYREKTEELSIRLVSLETELRSVLKQNNVLVQKIKESNEVKAEVEITKTSLEKCVAEKARLEHQLHISDVEKEQLDKELCSLKEMLRYSDVELDELKCCKDELEMKVASFQSKLDDQDAQLSLQADEKNELIQLQKFENELKNRLLEKESKIEDMEKHIFKLERELQQKVNALVEIERKLKGQADNTKSTADDTTGEVKSLAVVLGEPWQEFSVNEKKLQNNIDKVDLIDEHLNESALNSSLDRINKELEKMKRDNLAPFQQENELLCELDRQEPLQKEMELLQMVNKQLENMFPSFKEPARGGNVIDRVLALERELADALKANDAKKRQFQSSFVKQQADQAAMLQSFRDINELINDMLEVKRKNSVLEDELKELQNRYSQVSLQFAEVEGERQQLVMTVKNLRGGKKS